MASGRPDWLDRLARRAGGRNVRPMPGRIRGNDDVTGAGDVSADRFTRATSLKLAIIGAASLSLGLFKAPEVSAQSRDPLGECLDQCNGVYRGNGVAKRLFFQQLRQCNKTFAPAALAKKPAWRRFRRRLRLSPIAWNTVVDQLRSNCHAKAQSDFRNSRGACDRKCRNHYEYTPPSKPAPPVLPHAPTEADSYCVLCAKGAPTAYCDSCPSAPDGSVCCYLPAVDGKSPCCV